jgi:hypothetical protein
MHAGPIDQYGWVEWRMLPSTLTERDVAAVEREFGIEFPPLFRAFLLARFHLFGQVASRKYDQGIFMPDLPANRPLAPLRDLLAAWAVLINAQYIPIRRMGRRLEPNVFRHRSPCSGP